MGLEPSASCKVARACATVWLAVSLVGKFRHIHRKVNSLVPLLVSSFMLRNDYSHEQVDSNDGQSNERTAKIEGCSGSSAPKGRLTIAQRFIAGLAKERI